MSRIEFKIPDSLGIHLVAANTAAYLFRNFRGDPVVQNISRNYSPPDLLREIDACCELGISDFSELVRIYMLIVALSLKPSSGLIEQQKLDIRWFDKIIALGRSSMRASTITTVQDRLPEPAVSLINAKAAANGLIVVL